MIIIQHIKTKWTKKSRGMPDSIKRNAIPRVMDIPYIYCSEDEFLIHEISSYEDDNFLLSDSTTTTKIYKNRKNNKYWTFSFEPKDDILSVFFRYTYFEHGSPSRHTSKEAICKLKINEWVSIHINGRFTSFSGQYYEQHFINIANTSSLDTVFFSYKSPIKHIDLMVHLF